MRVINCFPAGEGEAGQLVERAILLRSTTTFSHTRTVADIRTGDLGRMTKRLSIGLRVGCRLES